MGHDTMDKIQLSIWFDEGMLNYLMGVRNFVVIESLGIGVRYCATWFGGMWLSLLSSKLFNKLE
jgi:hypothetical protein